ncbi:TKL family protein kinase [Trichomonas vaginalis G3]|uniref:TKL family protein kinase n=1 Tax=Trichomonas vaginalis (strain ATCC PRA-98 / G3) TaxID=412133 RepID=A2EBK6_TRIV3|nr:protein kinase protein [Trichomonas vaginalis G3]EAY09923.1 TKL family protein kinase [Trichomonas vaginalis G3]KAI5523061.1 protein kinase protein [Trichomonas vaginalis G3]|eukprot:XP_001322146.1 TKL family protein kinase [Trichomonas vaginalis G3]
MATWNGFPRSADVWNAEFAKVYANIDRIVERVVCNGKKIAAICIELDNFRNKLAKLTGNLTPDQIIKLFEFLKCCAAFMGIISDYQKHNWLKFFLSNDLNRQFNDLAELWTVWSEVSMSFCFNSFDSTDTLPLAHSLDLISEYQILSNMFNAIPPMIKKTVLAKLVKIRQIIEVKQISRENSETNKAILRHRDWEITDENIAQGGYAIVHLAKLRATNEELAIKELKPANLKPRTVGYLKREIDSMLALDHPNLLKLAGVTITAPFCIATGFLPNGDLYEILHGKNQKMKKPMLLSQISIDVARGLEYVHANHMVHRDLKPPNILMDKNWRAVICDFGLARYIGPNMTCELGTAQWMAPELFSGDGSYDTCVDVYAYGILLWELFTQQMPYTQMRLLQIAVGVLKEKMRPQFPPNSDPIYKNLIQSCWAHKKSARPTMKDVRTLLETGEYVVPGTNKAEFKKWIEETAPVHKAVMERYYREKHDKTTLVKDLLSASAIDPKVQNTMQQMIEANIIGEDVLDKVVYLIEMASNTVVQDLAKQIIFLMIEKKEISADRLALALLKVWNIYPEFVVDCIRKLAPNITKREEILKQVLVMSQPPVMVDMVTLIATEQHVGLVFKYLDKAHVIPVLSSFIESFGPTAAMLPASVTSITAIILMLRSVLQKKMLQLLDIPATEQMEKNIVSVTQKLNNNTWANNDKDANECIRMLAPMMRIAGPGLGTLDILKSGAVYPRIAEVICGLQLWNPIFGAFATNNNELLQASIELIHVLPLAPAIYQQGWQFMVSNYKQTKNQFVLSFIKEVLQKDQQFDVSSLICALFNSVGENTKKDVEMIQFILSINFEQHNFQMTREFTDTFVALMKSDDYNVPVGLSIFVLQYIDRCGISGLDDEIFGACMSFLYNRKPPFEAAVPILQILLVATSSQDHAAFLIKNGFADYLAELPILYPNEPKVSSILPQFVEGLKKSCK